MESVSQGGNTSRSLAPRAAAEFQAKERSVARR